MSGWYHIKVVKNKEIKICYWNDYHTHNAQYLFEWRGEN